MPADEVALTVTPSGVHRWTRMLPCSPSSPSTAPHRAAATRSPRCWLCTVSPAATRLAVCDSMSTGRSMTPTASCCTSSTSTRRLSRRTAERLISATTSRAPSPDCSQNARGTATTASAPRRAGAPAPASRCPPPARAGPARPRTRPVTSRCQRSLQPPRHPPKAAALPLLREVRLTTAPRLVGGDIRRYPMPWSLVRSRRRAWQRSARSPSCACT